MKQNYKLTKADCGKKITLEESRQVQLDMLDELVKFCDEHSLRYFLSGGTLLGAIRHNGFIPWDDDIDVNIPRPDCEKLLQLTGGRLGKYRLAGPDNGEYMDCCNWFRIYNDSTVIENYKGGLTKKNPYYHPIFIDVFPIDGLPARKGQRYLHWAIILFLNKMRRSSSLQHMEARTIWRHIFHIISAAPAKLVGYKRWGEVLQRCAVKYSFNTHEYIGVVLTTRYITREIIKKKDYLKGVKVTFEGKKYMAPGNYDIYLRQLYGDDYMKMPPINKQKSHHAFNMYWRSNQ